MTPKEHKERHILLHKHLNELLTDFCACTGEPLTKRTVIELVGWSCGQMLEPTKGNNHGHT